MRLLWLSLCVLVALSTLMLTHATSPLDRLNVPKDAKGVIFFGQGAHLDWDWLNFFTTNANNFPPDRIGYFNENQNASSQPADRIFEIATEYMQNSSYAYQVCEISFLRQFSQDRPASWKIFRQRALNGQVSLVGGGITSPDNLLPHGEALIRNYLIGMKFIKSQGLTWSKYVWLPDDFGHDSQLPSFLRAIGARGVAFARLPGGCQQGPNPSPTVEKSIHEILLDENNGGLEFEWIADDGAEMFTYYMPDHYSSGDGLNLAFVLPKNPKEGAKCLRSQLVFTTNEHLAAHLALRKPISTSPFVFVVAGSDFAVPVPNVTAAMETWNRDMYPQTGYAAVMDPFDKFANLVQWYHSTNTSANPLKKRTWNGKSEATVFRPTPYWTGFYSSRPALKQLHYRTSRLLVQCEILSTILRATKSTATFTQASIDVLWDKLSPSTHHDYVTGTSTDLVYEGEQLPLSEGTFRASLALRSKMLAAFAQMFHANASPDRILVLNTHGFSATGYAVMDIPSEHAEHTFNLQRTYDNKAIGIFTAPSLGWNVTSDGIFTNDLDPVSVDGDADHVVMENGLLVVEIARKNNWAISNIIDKATHKTVVEAANALEFRSDAGNIYRYGYEENCNFDKMVLSFQTGAFEIVEKGPIRAIFRTTVIVNGSVPSESRPRGDDSSTMCNICTTIVKSVDEMLRQNSTEEEIINFLHHSCTLLPGALKMQCTMAIDDYGRLLLERIIAGQEPQVVCAMIKLCPPAPEIPKPSLDFLDERFVFEYTLVQGEPFVRVNVTARAPCYTSVISSVQFSSPIASMLHGTPNHWTTKEPMAFGSQPDFNLTATHGFVLPRGSDGNFLGGIYHDASPSWGIRDDSLVGVILRNSPGGNGCREYGADGTDVGFHSILYAIRVPSKLNLPHTGQPQRESLLFTNPLLARAVSSSSKQPASFSFASLKGDTASYVSLAKGGSFDEKTFVIRVVNPSNIPTKETLIVTKSVAQGLHKVNYATALEEAEEEIKQQGDHLDFMAQYSLTTLLLD